MIEPFYKIFGDTPYPCYWLSSEGEFWCNQVAENLNELGAPTAMRNILEAASGGDQAPALTDALRLGGITLMPVAGGMFATCTGPRTTPMQAFSAGIREPLTNIYAVLPLLAKRLEDTDLAYAEEIQNNCYTLLRLASNLETAGRLEGKASDSQPIDLGALVDSICVCARSVCREQGIEITRKLPEESLVVPGDSKLLGEAILNVLRNALQYTRDNNQIHVKLSRTGSRAVLTIEDRGLGIRPENLERIFEPYFSADPYGDSPTRPGLGLGLAITAGVVRSLGGTIAAESRYGEGTRITLALPLADENNLGTVLGSDPADYLLNRYSAIYVQLCGFCRLPVV